MQNSQTFNKLHGTILPVSSFLAFLHGLKTDQNDSQDEDRRPIAGMQTISYRALVPEN